MIIPVVREDVEAGSAKHLRHRRLVARQLTGHLEQVEVIERRVAVWKLEQSPQRVDVDPVGESLGGARKVDPT